MVRRLCAERDCGKSRSQTERETKANDKYLQAPVRAMDHMRFH
jgi:hypothetical protein